MAIPIKSFIVGDNRNVGKSALSSTYSTGYFSDEYVPPICPTYETNKMVDGHLCALSIVDTETRKMHLGLLKILYSNANVVIVCYSAVDRDSFVSVIDKWWPEVTRYCCETPIVLVATKTDLRVGKGDSSEVTFEEGQNLSKEISAKCFIECSAKKNISEVKDVFESAARAYLEDHEDIVSYHQSHSQNCVLT